MKKRMTAAALMLLLFLNGCGDPYALPDHPVQFRTGHTEDKNGDGYQTIEWNGKTYAPYGIPRTQAEFAACLGYVGDDRNDRVFAAEGLLTDMYLLNFYVGGEMEQAVYYRALDTFGAHAPEQIEPLGYALWTTG